MRRIGLLATLGVLLVTVAWWMFLVSPKNGEIADLERDLNVAVDTEQRLKIQLSELETIRQSEVEYLAALGRLDALIPERPLLEEFIEQIHELTSETGVELLTLAPAFPELSEESELREVSVSAQIEGEFFEILGLLFGLNDMERLVRVDSIAVSSTLDEDGGTILSTSVQMQLFTLADLFPLLDEVDALTPDGVPGSDEPSDGGVEALGDGS